MVGFITSHVLDTSLGLPAEGIMIELISIKGNKRLLMNSAVTNSDGRLDSPIMEKNKFNKGTYELLFYVKEYFENKHKKSNKKWFLDIIPIRFIISDDSHYHIPLLLSPFGYSTYRGS